MDITTPAGQPVAADFVSHGSQTHAQKPGGARAVSARGLQRHFKQPALHVFERDAGTQAIIGYGAVRHTTAGNTLAGNTITKKMTFTKLFLRENAIVRRSFLR